jgi:nucleoside-diphosphate-sugar epimerase
VAQGKLLGKVLVTGSTGFLGHRLVAALSRCGADVIALVRDESLVSPDIERHAKIISGDVRDPGSVKLAMQNVDFVYHCAAITTNVTSWESHYSTNVTGSDTVFRTALSVGVQRLIHVSSVVVYGVDRSAYNSPVEETAPYAHKVGKWEYYLRSKMEADKLAFEYWHKHKLPITVLRLGILYGPGGRGSIGKGVMQLGSIRLNIGNGRNRLPFIYVDNAIDCLLLAAVSPEAVGQAFNVVDEPQISVRDVISLREQVVGERLKTIVVPPFLLATLSKLLEVKRTLSNSHVPPRLSQFSIRSACRNLEYDTRKARQQLGWYSEVCLEEGLRRALEGDLG